MRFSSLIVIGLLTAVGCSQDVPKLRPPTTVGTYPHAMERLARLQRAELRSSKPKEIEQAIMCEGVRVSRVLGEDFEVRRAWLEDSPRSEFTPEQQHQTLVGLSLGYFEVGGPTCDPINAEAQRDVPLPLPKKWRKHTAPPFVRQVPEHAQE